MEKSLRERTSFHEAGHILIHLITGIKIKDLDIIENNKLSKVVIHDSYDLSQKNISDLNDSLIMCIRAGCLTEKNYCWRRCINFDPEIPGTDMWQISRLFYEEKNNITWRESFEKHMNDLDKETENLLKKHWSFVRIIARSLFNNKALTIEEINRLWLLHKKGKE